MKAIFYGTCLVLGLCLHAVASQFVEKPADWEQPIRMLDRKYELKYNNQQMAIEEMQGRIVTLENTLEDLLKDKTVEAALDRRWEALGE
jgi:hypothetical protein